MRRMDLTGVAFGGDPRPPQNLAFLPPTGSCSTYKKGSEVIFRPDSCVGLGAGASEEAPGPRVDHHQALRARCGSPLSCSLSAVTTALADLRARGVGNLGRGGYQQPQPVRCTRGLERLRQISSRDRRQFNLRRNAAYLTQSRSS